MAKLLSLLISTGVFSLWALAARLEPVVLLNLYVLVPATVVGAVIPSILPSQFEVGIQGWKTTGLIGRLIPAVVLAALTYSISFIPQTMSTAIVSGIGIGNIVRYILLVILTQVMKGGKK